MATIINMTPHPVTIVTADGQVVNTFPKGENTIRLAVKTVAAGELDGVKLTKTEFGEAQGLPEFVEGTYYIVSQLVKTALSDRTDLLVPAEVVRDTNGNILGCQSLGI